MGATNSGSDYYFSYGDVLYIVLNSNNRNAAEHSKLMEKAIKSAPNAKWKVVAFHHDIYGSGQPHSDFDGANLRTIFAPLMDKCDIDVCLTVMTIVMQEPKVDAAALQKKSRYGVPKSKPVSSKHL